MLPEGEFHMLRDLYRQGLSISEIARQTGYNRRTVSKYVNDKVPPVSRKPSESQASWIPTRITSSSASMAAL